MIHFTRESILESVDYFLAYYDPSGVSLSGGC